MIHGHTVNRRRSPEYRAWHAMQQRCYYTKGQAFPRYGGRGIRVCDQWRGRKGFVQFLADIGPKPSPKHSIDRIDNDGNYEPGNCRWATATEQNRNKRAPNGRWIREDKCPWGHLLNAANLSFSPTGSRRCRACQRRIAEKRRRKKRRERDIRRGIRRRRPVVS